MGRVVISGSSGLVGSAVVQYMMENTQHDLVLIDKKPASEMYDSQRVNQITVDLQDPEAWAIPMKGTTALIHCAALAQPSHASAAITHNLNVSLSYNALRAATVAGVTRVVLIGSINAIGGAWNPDSPEYKYFPIDEEHPRYPVESYSLSKYIGEIQADCVARANPWMSIATLRSHFVAPQNQKPSYGHKADAHFKDLWGWTSTTAVARACLLALEMGDDRQDDGIVRKGIQGHEIFFIVSDEHCAEGYTATELATRFFPCTEILRELGDTEGFYSCVKAERILGWKHDGGLVPKGNW